MQSACHLHNLLRSLNGSLRTSVDRVKPVVFGTTHSVVVLAGLIHHGVKEGLALSGLPGMGTFFGEEEFDLVERFVAGLSKRKVELGSTQDTHHSEGD